MRKIRIFSHVFASERTGLQTKEKLGKLLFCKGFDAIWLTHPAGFISRVSLVRSQPPLLNSNAIRITSCGDFVFHSQECS
jgi:hypothetical protein